MYMCVCVYVCVCVCVCVLSRRVLVNMIEQFLLIVFDRSLSIVVFFSVF